MIVAALLAGLAALSPASAEICRYDGVTTHAGHVVARTEVAAVGGVLIVDVTLALDASTWLFDVQYRVQEISTWRGGGLQSLAVNNRYGVDGHIRRQQWDVLTRGSAGLEAYRVQAKTLAEMQRRHPAFARHWDSATFGQPWLQDYAAAAAERRPDLDLPGTAMPPGLRPPLALAFYWSRRLPPGGETVPAFLPGFKQDARLDVPFGAVAPGDGWRRWQAPVHHAALSAAPVSTTAAWVSPDGRLLQLAFDVHARQGSAQGTVRQQGCEGTPVPPPVN